jgi:hypothetical protein
MIKSTKALLLAEASALAILASAAEANAETFAFTGAEQTFTASVSGEYAVELLGASGGNGGAAVVTAGGLGAEVSGDVFLTAGEDLTLFVGGQGGSAQYAGGGGGSFVFLGTDVFNGADVLAVAGGGGGAGGLPGLDGGPGLAGTSGGTERRSSGSGTGGMGGIGGGGGVANGGGGGAGRLRRHWGISRPIRHLRIDCRPHTRRSRPSAGAGSPAAEAGAATTAAAAPILRPYSRIRS